MDNADEDDLKDLLERPSATAASDALSDANNRTPPNCLLERNGFSNVVTMIDTARQQGLVEHLAVTSLLNNLRTQAEIGIIFLDMHNAGKNPFWHQAVKAHRERVK